MLSPAGTKADPATICDGMSRFGTNCSIRPARVSQGTPRDTEAVRVNSAWAGCGASGLRRGHHPHQRGGAAKSLSTQAMAQPGGAAGTRRCSATYFAAPVLAGTAKRRTIAADTGNGRGLKDTFQGKAHHISFGCSKARPRYHLQRFAPLCSGSHRPAASRGRSMPRD